MELGVHSSLHQNCHHQVIYAKINLNVFSCTLWTWNIQIIYQIQRAIEQFSWEKSFRNLNVNEIASLFNRTIKNVLLNHIPQETIICDDRDPPWINNNIKQLIQEKNNAYRSYILNDKNFW